LPGLYFSGSQKTWRASKHHGWIDTLDCRGRHGSALSVIVGQEETEQRSLQGYGNLLGVFGQSQRDICLTLTIILGKDKPFRFAKSSESVILNNKNNNLSNKT
jgi:hypothetical protein